MPGIISPDTRNMIPSGKGFILFQPEGGEKYHVGSVPSFSFTPKTTTLDHFSPMEGTKLKDDTTVISKDGEIKMSMEEATYRNMAMLMAGAADITDPDNISIDILSESLIAGELWFYATNDKGPRWYANFKRVVFAPSGAFDPIGDKYATLDVTGTIEAVDGAFGTMTLKGAVNAVAPENIIVPQIAGLPDEGLTLQGGVGAWVGAKSYAFQWKRNGVNITDATEKTYVVQTADYGEPITLSVTATNAVGSTTAVSAPTDLVTV